MMEDPIRAQIDNLIDRRIETHNLLSPFQAAVSLLRELGAEEPDEIDDKRAARTYLARLVDELSDS